MHIILFVLTALFLACSHSLMGNFTSSNEPFKVGSTAEPFSSYCSQLNTTAWSKCGVIPEINKKFLSSRYAHYGEFPWQAAVVDSKKQFFLCGGALVTQRHILTSASCVVNRTATEITVRLGDWDILSEVNPGEAFDSLEIPSVKKFIHPDFLPSNTRLGYNYAYDVAVLKLKHDIDFQKHPHILPACLFRGSVSNVTHSNCRVAGWSASPVVELHSLYDTLEYSQDSLTENKFAPAIPTPNLEVFPLHPKAEKIQSEIESILEYTNLKETINTVLQNHTLVADGNEAEKISEVKTEDIQEECDAFAGDVTESRILSKASVDIDSEEKCKSRIEQHFSVNTTSSQICLSGTNNDECKGDIGSPVVCKMTSQKKSLKPDEKFVDRYSVIGVINRKFGCADEKPALLLAANIVQGMDFICRALSMN